MEPGGTVRLVDTSELSARLAYLFHSGEGADVELVVVPPVLDADCPPVRFLAHRCILLSASHAFRLLLDPVAAPPLPIGASPLSAVSATGAGGRTTIATTSVVIIHDVPPAAFALLLAYLYTGEVALAPHSAVDVYLAADRFELPHLRDLAADYLPRGLDLPASLPFHLVAALRSGLLPLVRSVAGAIVRRLDDVVRVPAFYRLPPAVITALLSNPDACLDSEEVAVAAAVAAAMTTAAAPSHSLPPLPLPSASATTAAAAVSAVTGIVDASASGAGSGARYTLLAPPPVAPSSRLLGPCRYFGGVWNSPPSYEPPLPPSSVGSMSGRVQSPVGVVPASPASPSAGRSAFGAYSNSHAPLHPLPTSARTTAAPEDAATALADTGGVEALLSPRGADGGGVAAFLHDRHSPPAPSAPSSPPLLSYLRAAQAVHARSSGAPTPGAPPSAETTATAAAATMSPSKPRPLSGASLFDAGVLPPGVTPFDWVTNLDAATAAPVRTALTGLLPSLHLAALDLPQLRSPLVDGVVTREAVLEALFTKLGAEAPAAAALHAMLTPPAAGGRGGSGAVAAYMASAPPAGLEGLVSARVSRDMVADLLSALSTSFVAPLLGGGDEASSSGIGSRRYGALRAHPAAAPFVADIAAPPRLCTLVAAAPAKTLAPGYQFSAAYPPGAATLACAGRTISFAHMAPPPPSSPSAAKPSPAAAPPPSVAGWVAVEPRIALLPLDAADVDTVPRGGPGDFATGSVGSDGSGSGSGGGSGEPVTLPCGRWSWSLVVDDCDVLFPTPLLAAVGVGAAPLPPPLHQYDTPATPGGGLSELARVTKTVLTRTDALPFDMAVLLVPVAPWDNGNVAATPAAAMLERAVWMCTNRGRVLVRALLEATDGSGLLVPGAMSEVAEGVPWGVGSVVTVAVDTRGGHVGVSLTSGRPLGAEAPAGGSNSAAARRASSISALRSGLPGRRASEAVGRGGSSSAGGASAAAGDSSATGYASPHVASPAVPLLPPHPFNLPATGTPGAVGHAITTGVKSGMFVATLRGASMAATDSARSLFACVCGVALPPPNPSYSALQLVLVASSTSGLTATLIPAHAAASREGY